MVVEINVTAGDKENVPISPLKSARLGDTSGDVGDADCASAKKVQWSSALERMLADFDQQEIGAFGRRAGDCTAPPSRASDRVGDIGQNLAGAFRLGEGSSSGESDGEGGYSDGFEYDMIDLVRDAGPAAPPPRAEAPRAVSSEDEEQPALHRSSSPSHPEARGAGEEWRRHPAETFFSELALHDTPQKAGEQASGGWEGGGGAAARRLALGGLDVSDARRSVNFSEDTKPQGVYSSPTKPPRASFGSPGKRLSGGGGGVDESLNQSWLDKTLSPVTPGKEEAYDGRYFLEEDDHGVDIYMRACAEMRTAPISQIVKNAADIQSLELAHRGVGDRGCVGMCTFLLGNRTISAIDLADNNVGSAGGAALFDALSKTRRVTELNLAGNSLAAVMGDVGKVLAPGQVLQLLNVERNKIGDREAEALATGLRDCPALAELRLGSNSIADRGLAALCSAISYRTCALRAINLDWNKIRSVAPLAAALQGGAHLVHVSLQWNKIGTAGAKALALALQDRGTLQYLDISHNEVGEGACGELARMIATASRLQTLCASGNPSIGDVGALALLSGITEDAPLARLELCGCGLRGVGGEIPTEVVAPEASSVLSGADNVYLLREMVPHLLGTLPPPEAEASVQMKVVKKVVGGGLRRAGSAPFRDDKWNLNVRTTAEDEAALRRKRAADATTKGAVAAPPKAAAKPAGGGLVWAKSVGGGVGAEKMAGGAVKSASSKSLAAAGKAKAAPARGSKPVAGTKAKASTGTRAKKL